MFKTLKTADLLEKVEQGTKVIDVREVTEFENGHIAGAINLPLGELDQRFAELDKDEEVYVVCHSGNRSGMACRFLDAQGFSNITNVIPGMSGWIGEVVVGK